MYNIASKMKKIKINIESIEIVKLKVAKKTEASNWKTDEKIAILLLWK